MYVKVGFKRLNVGCQRRQPFNAQEDTGSLRRDHKKKSYKRRTNESVNEESLS